MTPFSIFLMSMVVLPLRAARGQRFSREFADGQVGDLLERPAGLAGGLEQVLVFRLDVDRPAAERGHLEADLLAADPDGLGTRARGRGGRRDR